MKKILDIVLIGLLFLVAFNFLSGDKQASTSSEVLFKTTKSSYSLPASVWFDIKNSTSESLIIDTCENISVIYNGGPIDLWNENCEKVTINPSESKIIDFASSYTAFDKTWAYTFKLNIDDKEYISGAKVKNRWTIGKLFVGVFYAPIYNLLIFLVQLFSNSLGWAIIAVTVLIRIALLYPQHQMMVSQRKLQAIQPKIKKIQEKYKKDSQKLGVELMALYKKEKVNPMGSCGFLIIQMPIILVIYNIILNIKNPANEFYLYEFLSNFHIADMSFMFFGIDLLASGWVVGVVLAIFIAFIQFIQIKLSLTFNKKNTPAKKDGVVLEKKKWASDYSSMMPDPEMMNKFMLYGMPWMVAVFTYTLFAWIGLYWGISTLFAIGQQLVVNKLVNKDEIKKTVKEAQSK